MVDQLPAVDTVGKDIIFALIEEATAGSKTSGKSFALLRVGFQYPGEVVWQGSSVSQDYDEMYLEIGEILLQKYGAKLYDFIPQAAKAPSGDYAHAKNNVNEFRRKIKSTRVSAQAKVTGHFISFLETTDSKAKFQILTSYLKLIKPKEKVYLRGFEDGRYTITTHVGGWMETVDTPLNLTETVVEALLFAKAKYQELYRPDGEPFFTHVLDVFSILISSDHGWERTLLAAALLGVFSYTKTSYQEISEKFGEPAAKAVAALTQGKDETIDSYVDRLFNKEIGSDDYDSNKHIFTANFVCLAARLANLETLPYLDSPETAKSYLEETNKMFSSITNDPILLDSIRYECRLLEKCAK